MEHTLQNLLTMHNFLDLSAISEGSTFGEQMQKASISFSLGYLSKVKILTADKLLARQWPCNPLYPHCNLALETASHLILHCPFAQQVWALVKTWTHSIVRKPVQGLDVMTWWEKELAHLPKKDRRLKAAVMIYGAWNIWKARNKKVFEQKNMNPGEVLQEIKFEMQCRSSACGRPELSSFNV